MNEAQWKQAYEGLFGKPLVPEGRCDKRVCLWLVIDVPGFSSESGVQVGADAGGEKMQRRHRPFLTAGKTNGDEYRVLLLTSQERRFSVSARECNEFCSNFRMYEKSYVFEWGRNGAAMVLIPAGLIRDKDLVKFCGTCRDASILPQGVLNACFVP